MHRGTATEEIKRETSGGILQDKEIMVGEEIAVWCKSVYWAIRGKIGAADPVRRTKLQKKEENVTVDVWSWVLVIGFQWIE